MPGKDGLVRIYLKRAFSDGTDGTVAVDLDPLSLLSRLAASVPYPHFHTVRYGVLASASKLRRNIAPKPPSNARDNADALCMHTAFNEPGPIADEHKPRRPTRLWAELLKRTFAFDVLSCAKGQGPMRLVALLTEERERRRYLSAIGEATELPAKATARGPHYWKSKALRQKELGDDAA